MAEAAGKTAREAGTRRVWSLVGLWLGGLLLAWLVGSTAVGFLTVLLEPLLGGRELCDFPAVAWPLGLAAGLGATLPALLVRRRGRYLRLLTEWLVLVVLPAWALILDLGLPGWGDACAAINAPFAAPDVIGLYPLYGLCLLAYAVARKRPERLRPLAEALVVGGLTAGVVLAAALAVQFGIATFLALVFAPIGLPAAAPAAVGLLFLLALIGRLRRRARERGAGQGGAAAWWGLGLAAPLLGLWAVLQRLLFERGPQAIWTETYGWILSQRTPPPTDCHYLCTVAARGHPRLVRPQRLGRRRGRVILVNRQLALANAFEDMLGQRWPRLARAARRAYDRLGRPLAGRIRSRWACDLTYLAMKPAEWLFGLLLLLFDPADPEARIGRMYAPAAAPGLDRDALREPRRPRRSPP